MAYQTQGTVVAASNFDAESDCAHLRKAMKGMGTDEKAIIDILCNRSNAQRQEIKTAYKAMHGRDLGKDFKSELGGKLERIILGLMMESTEFDAVELRNCMKGVGTTESGIIDIMCTRTGPEIQAITAFYNKKYGRKLESDLGAETSGYFKKLMVSMSSGGRKAESTPVDQAKARQHAQDLHGAGAKRLGTDESVFQVILSYQSFPQVRATMVEYRQLTGKSLQQAVSDEMSGDVKDGFLAVLDSIENTAAYFAMRLYKSMKGAGTDDDSLIRTILSRSEVDMVQIKEEFQRKYNKDLRSFIEGDCSGYYKKVLIALVK